MDFDIARQIGALTRAVEDRTVGGKPARAVVAEWTFDTDIADLWDAITSAERIPGGSCRSRVTSASAATTSSRATPGAR